MVSRARAGLAGLPGGWPFMAGTSTAHAEARRPPSPSVVLGSSSTIGMRREPAHALCCSRVPSAKSQEFSTASVIASQVTCVPGRLVPRRPVRTARPAPGRGSPARQDHVGRRSSGQPGAGVWAHRCLPRNAAPAAVLAQDISRSGRAVAFKTGRPSVRRATSSPAADTAATATAQAQRCTTWSTVAGLSIGSVLKAAHRARPAHHAPSSAVGADLTGNRERTTDGGEPARRRGRSATPMPGAPGTRGARLQVCTTASTHWARAGVRPSPARGPGAA